MTNEQLKETLEALPIIRLAGEDVTKCNVFYTDNVVYDLIQRRSCKVALITSCVSVGVCAITGLIIGKLKKKED